MSKLKTKLAEFDKETGKATYIYAYKNYTFEGTAQCHEDDFDFCSEKVGLDLAEIRAFYKYLKVRRDELVIRVETLESMLKDMSTSKSFQITSKYGIKLQTAICDSRIELHETRDAINSIPRIIKTKIAGREDLYKKIRERRKAEAEVVVESVE